MPRALLVALALVLAAAGALAPSAFVVVPTTAGTWRGVLDPPTATRVLACALLALAAAGLIARAAPEAGRPWLALALALAPLVPVATGRLVPLLAFQGPVLTLVLGACAGASLAGLLAARKGEAGPAPAPWLFAAAFLFYALLGRQVPGAAGPQGDEPHYLAMAHSLLSDGDLDLTDEYAAREYAAFFPAQLTPHASPNSPADRIYSHHSPGLPLLVLPGYAVLGFRGAQLVVGALVALAGVLVHRLVRDAAGDVPAILAWAAFALTPPVPFFAVSLYPESVAVLGTATLLWAARRTPGPAPALVAALAAAALPWLHAKMLPLAACGLALVLIRPHRLRERLLASAFFAASLGALLVFFHRWYGRWSFGAAYGPADFDLARLPWGAAALLFDRQFGLLVTAPAYVLAVAGLVLAWRRATGDALRGVLMAAIPLAVGGSFATWWGGASPPARFLLPALPGLALGMGLLMAARTRLAGAVLGLSLTLVALAADAPRVLHNRADGESLLLRFLSPTLDLNSLLPSFFAPDQRARPLVDQRLATLEVLDRWDGGNARGATGPLDIRALAIPFELPRRPWRVGPDDVRHSRRLGAPPGVYRLEVVLLRPQEGRQASGTVEVHSGELILGRHDVTTEDPSRSWPLVLPAGARHLGATVLGGTGVLDVDAIRLRAEAVVPRRARGPLAWPELALGDRYRVGDAVKTTALDRSEPEDGGFRLAGAHGDFLVDGPPGMPVVVEVRRGAAASGDRVEWAERVIDLGRAAAVQVPLALEDGVDLGTLRVVRLRVRAASGPAWIAVRAARE